jgi:predicted membrane-bound spermidine synthase
MIELQDNNGINRETFDPIMESALLNIQKAQNTYMKLVEKAKNTPYNSSVLDKLKNFPYYGFMLSNRLIPLIFNEVEGYLRAGNVTGIFKMKVERMISINILLNILKSNIYINKDAAIATAMELSEAMANSSIFGSYVARVFKQLNK